MQEKEEFLKKFSINLRKFRLEKKLTQMEMVVMLDIPRSSYLKYESVKNVPDLQVSNLFKIAKFFNKSIDEFFK